MSLPLLVGMIFLFNVMTFGNGPVMIPLLQKNLVEEQAVLTVDQLLYSFAIARVTPGQANMYVAAIGYMLYGWVGAILCVLAITLPGYLMIPLLKGFEHFKNNQQVKSFTRGLTTTSVGLIFAATLQIGKSSLTSLIAWVVFLVALGLTYLLKWNPILTLVVASVVGVLLKLWA